MAEMLVGAAIMLVGVIVGAAINSINKKEEKHE
jgi:hypothetical protein